MKENEILNKAEKMIIANFIENSKGLKYFKQSPEQTFINYHKSKAENAQRGETLKLEIYLETIEKTLQGLMKETK